MEPKQGTHLVTLHAKDDPKKPLLTFRACDFRSVRHGKVWMLDGCGSFGYIAMGEIAETHEEVAVLVEIRPEPVVYNIQNVAPTPPPPPPPPRVPTHQMMQTFTDDGRPQKKGKKG